MPKKNSNMDLEGEIIELYYQLRRTQNILEMIMKKINPKPQLSYDEIADAEHSALEYLQKKFPNMDIEIRK